MDSFERQEVLNAEHLRLLRIGYFVMGGVSAFTSLFGIFYAFMGVFVLSTIRHSPASHGQPPPEFIAWLFAAIGLLIVVLGGTYAALAFFTARNLRLRRGRTICLVTAGLTCIYIPFGTLLGIFTFSVLGQPSVIQWFAYSSADAPLTPPLPPPRSP